jgi:hypothetical protein
MNLSILPDNALKEKGLIALDIRLRILYIILILFDSIE